MSYNDISFWSAEVTFTVNTIEKKVENQIQFWSLIGPFLILASVAVLLFKMSDHWYFPVSALVGIPLCVKWKMKGMAAALACLFVLSIMAYRSVDLDEQYWHVGMGLSMAFALIVLTLSIEEVEGLISKAQLESKSRLDNFLHLEEALKDSELSREKDCERLRGHIATLTQENAKVIDDKQTLYKLAQLAKEELVQLHTHHQLLLEDLIYKKQQISNLNEKLEETEITLQELVNNDGNQKIKHLTGQLDVLSNQITEQEHEKERLHVAIVRAQDQSQNLHEIVSKQKRLIEEQLERMEEFKKVQEQYRLVESKLRQTEEEKDQLANIKQAQEGEVEKLQNEVLKLQASLQVRIKEFEDEVARNAQQQNGDIERLQREIVDINEQLKKSQAELKSTLDHLKMLDARLQLKLEDQCRLPAQGGNTRRMENMYVQLKKQFEEKNNVLETTRQDLFFANEKLELFKRAHEENELFSIAESECFLLKDLNRLSQELDDLERKSTEEIEELHKIIAYSTKRN